MPRWATFIEIRLLTCRLLLGPVIILQLARNLLAGRDWTYTGHFPRVVFCDYDKVELGSVQHKTVQCALAINILNEKVRS